MPPPRASASARRPLRRSPVACLFAVLGAVWVVSAIPPGSGPAARAGQGHRATWSVADLSREISTFLGAELDAHLRQVASLDPPPAQVFSAKTTGEFTWGTFMRALAAYGELAQVRGLAGRDLARQVADVGLLERRLGGTRFSQLYAALSLRHFGLDLATNRMWQTMSAGEQAQWTQLLDVRAFYDPGTRKVINLPENYLGVASRIVAVAWKAGLLSDRDLLDGVLDRAAAQFVQGQRFADDDVPSGRYDRYSNEYARYVWDAATLVGREDIRRALRPSLVEQMALWWDLVAPDGYAYPWGRSLGAIGYMDTMEIVGFLGEFPEFRPAPLDQLGAAYARAWRWLRHDYRNDTRLLSVFAFGRGNYGYITSDREWQQTVGFFGKVAHAQLGFGAAAVREGVERVPEEIAASSVARYVTFRTSPGRQWGVWVVRQGPLRFALPFTSGPSGGVADYLPAPHGLPGFAAPVEQRAPAFTPYIELGDGRTMVTANGADAVEVSPDGRRVKATWTRWAPVGPAKDLVDPGLTSEVTWTIDGHTLTRRERVTASRGAVDVRRWTFVIPTTARQARAAAGEIPAFDLEADEGRLSLAFVSSDWPLDVRLAATGDRAEGRGARGAIPLHVVATGEGFSVAPGRPLSWTIKVTASPPR